MVSSARNPCGSDIIITVDYKVRETNKGSTKLRVINIILGILLLIIFGVVGYNYLFDNETIEEQVASRLIFDNTVSEPEQEIISQKFIDSEIELESDTTVNVNTLLEPSDTGVILGVYVPVTSFGAVRQNINTDEFDSNKIVFLEDTPQIVREAIQEQLSIYSSSLIKSLDGITEESIAIIPATKISSNIKLLSLNDSYYLDDFLSGGIYRTVSFSSSGSATISNLDFYDGYSGEEILKVNMTGVTALTREMQKKLSSVKDPTYFSAKIGDFLADADITHVSNEVSFLENCPYSYTAFCSPPEFIETLKASGVDLVELTGNHNNDLGSEANTDTINLYKELGWATIGGGLNSEEAAKPYIADMEGSKIAFLAYNYPDSPNGGAISGADRAGANSFDFSYESIKADIDSAKQNSDFVIVNIQYWECYSYPDGYIEFPICDKPIDGQEETFKKMIDLGADMVIGSSAHQPQTYEIYEGKPIYYGLGNLYFEQTQWPGTERGIILTHYFMNGALLQTKLTPTVYDRDLQTRIMTPEESNYLLTRLHDAR